SGEDERAARRLGEQLEVLRQVHACADLARHAALRQRYTQSALGDIVRAVEGSGAHGVTDRCVGIADGCRVHLGQRTLATAELCTVQRRLKLADQRNRIPLLEETEPPRAGPTGQL